MILILFFSSKDRINWKENIKVYFLFLFLEEILRSIYLFLFSHAMMVFTIHLSLSLYIIFKFLIGVIDKVNSFWINWLSFTMCTTSNVFGIQGKYHVWCQWMLVPFDYFLKLSSINKWIRWLESFCWPIWFGRWSYLFGYNVMFSKLLLFMIMGLIVIDASV